MRRMLRYTALVALLSVLGACGDTGTPPGGEGGEAGTVPELTCPPRWEGESDHWVPREPPDDVGSRLVPDGRAAESVLCRYDGSNTKSFTGTKLAWHGTPPRRGLGRALSDLTRLSRNDAGEPLVCTMIAGPQRNYLLGLRYRDGDVVWVSGADDPNGCVPTSNGRFTTSLSAKPVFTALAEAAGSVQPTP